MGTPIITDILDSTVGKVVDRLTDRFLPTSLGEKEREELKLEARRIASEEYKAASVDSQSARALAEKEAWPQAPSWTRVLTVTHRPIWSYAALSLFVWTVLAPYLGFGEFSLSEVHSEIMKTVIIFYFGGRSLEKTAETVWKRAGKP
ncbi:MAG: hypothetical protein A2052_06750 [Deltaproteobacteria bacterium GWA2_54_12]|nr:MAG: hypothetical protein A2052_06750 [Deltaproteobacteria bacterium GWA2_54_12]